MTIRSVLLALCFAAPLAACDGASAPETITLDQQQLEQGRQQRHRLWYTQPATDWMTEALPIGNGVMGAMFFGGVDAERIQFNEESLWTGGLGEWADYRGGNRPDAYRFLPEVRELLDNNRFKEAHALARRELTGQIKAEHADSVWEGFGAYQDFGSVHIDVARSGDVGNYRRQLALDSAIGSVSYSAGGVAYHREYFASYPHRVIAMRLTSNQQGGSDYCLRQESPHAGHQARFDNGVLTLFGKLQNNGMAYESRMLVDTDGELEWNAGELCVSAAGQLTLYLTAATDYLNQYPHYSGRDYSALNAQTIAAVRATDYDSLRREHIADFSALFSRVELDLGQEGLNSLPTDQRLARYKTGASDNSLEALYFDYGRYLLISSSRPGSLPANLQGKWNDSTAPKWASDYHANINIQMIYWLAEVANLPEVHAPLIAYIDSLRAPGRVTAQEFFNARGWNVHVANNIFGYTAPGWDLPWGFFPAGAAWYGRHVWEHYDYSRDLDYLRETGYPILRETAEFWLDHLVADTGGHLSSSPSYSPEHGTISAGAYMDVEIVWDLFSSTLQAAQVLGIDDDFTRQVAAARERLLPLQVGRWGQLQEWKEDVDDPDSRHRHLSHLYALYPGEQVSLSGTPELAEAARVSLVARGDEGTGWSIGWKVNFWARLMEGDLAHQMVRRALQRAGKPGFLQQYIGLNMLTGGGVYANLLSTHPPFQLDGNMGTASGIAEMLLQSHGGIVRLLPALPAAWSEGAVRGLKVRGNAELSMAWAEGELSRAEVVSQTGGQFVFDYQGQRITKELAPGVPVVLGFRRKSSND
jgi:alpha-L-fucosidase 2